MRSAPPPSARATAARSPWAWWARSWPSGEETFQKALRLVNGSVHGFEPQGAWDDRAVLERELRSSSLFPTPAGVRASQDPSSDAAT